MSELSQMPSQITAGTTTKYSKSFSDYPAPAWSMTVHIAGKGKIAVAAVAAGAGFAVTITAVQSAALDSGAYTWVERVTNGTEVYDAATGLVLVKPDPGAASAGDFQTWASRMVERLEALLEGRITSDVAETMQIGGRAVSKIPVEQLWALLQSLRAEVSIQRRGGRIMRSVLVRISGTGFDR